MVFYNMANFKRKKIDGFMWGSPLARAVFLASLPVSFLITIMIDILSFLFFKVNVFDDIHFQIAFAIGLILNATLLDYIYINRKRYDDIMSNKYKVFKLSINSGAIISFLAFIVGLIGCLGTPLVIDALLKK